VTPVAQARLQAYRTFGDDDERVVVWVIGRAGAGKSALVAALRREDEQASERDSLDSSHEMAAWREWTTRGRESESASPSYVGMASRPVDVIVVACPATEVDAAIDDDIAAWRSIAECATTVGESAPALVALLTRADELPPPERALPPFEGTRKRENIAAAIARLRRHMNAAKLTPAAILATCVVDDGNGHVRAWNVDVLRRRVLRLAVRGSRHFARLRDTRRIALRAAVARDIVDAAIQDVRAAPVALPTAPSLSLAAAEAARVEQIRATMSAALRTLALDASRSPTSAVRFVSAPIRASMGAIERLSGWLAMPSLATNAAAARLRVEGDTLRWSLGL